MHRLLTPYLPSGALKCHSLSICNFKLTRNIQLTHDILNLLHKMMHRLLTPYLLQGALMCH